MRNNIVWVIKQYCFVHQRLCFTLQIHYFMELNSLLFSFTPSLWTRQLFFQVWFRKGICLSSFLLIRFRTIRILFAMQMCRDASLCISQTAWKSKKIHQSALRCKGRPFSSDSFDILTLWQNALLSFTRTYTGVTTRNRLYMTRRIMQFPNRPSRIIIEIKPQSH